MAIKPISVSDIPVQVDPLELELALTEKSGNPKKGLHVSGTMGKICQGLTQGLQVTGDKTTGASKDVLAGRSARVAMAKEKAAAATENATTTREKIRAKLKTVAPSSTENSAPTGPEKEPGVLSSILKASYSVLGHKIGHLVKSSKIGIGTETAMVTTHEFSTEESKGISSPIISAVSEVAVTTALTSLGSTLVGCNFATATVAGFVAIKPIAQQSKTYFANLPEQDRQMMREAFDMDPDKVISFETGVKMAGFLTVPGDGIDMASHTIADAAHAVVETMGSIRRTMADPNFPVK